MPFFADQLPNAEKVVAKVSITPHALLFLPALYRGSSTVGMGHTVCWQRAPTECRVMYACEGGEHRTHCNHVRLHAGRWCTGAAG